MKIHSKMHLNPFQGGVSQNNFLRGFLENCEKMQKKDQFFKNP